MGKNLNILYVLLFLIVVFNSCSENVINPTGYPLQITIAPDSAILKTGETKKFTSYGYDSKGNLIDINPTWAADSDIGIINQNGYFFASLDIPGLTSKTGYVYANYNNLGTKIPVTIQLGNYWIFSDLHAPDFKYDQPNPPTDHGGYLSGWGSLTNVGGISDDPSDVPAEGGSKSLKLNYTAAGGVFWIYRNASWVVTDENLSAYTNGKLCFLVKSTVNLEIKLEDNDGAGLASVSKYLTSYTTLDGTWRSVKIPLKDFSGLNFKRLSIIMGIHYAASAVVHVDEIYYSPE